MKKLLIILALFLPAANIIAQHQPPPEARGEVEMGLKAHRQSHFEEATQHFQRALAIDKDFCWARLYVAGSLGAQYVPHVESADNLAKAKLSYEHYQTAMKCDPGLSTSALRGMAYLKVLMGQPAEARDLYRQLLKIEGDYRDTYYAIAMCDLAEAEANTAAEKARLGLKADESLASDPVCPALRKRNLPLAEDGLEMLSKANVVALLLPTAATRLMRLPYTRRAEIECGDPAAKNAAEKKRRWEMECPGSKGRQ